MFERIVVAVDGSEPSNHALSVACGLAEKYGSEIHLVHSPQVETMAIAVGAGAVELKPELDAILAAGRQVVEAAEATVTKAGCRLGSSVTGTQDPVTDILSTVEKAKADLVVMGRRGLGGVTGLLLGSVSQKVSHGATCSCLTVA